MSAPGTSASVAGKSSKSATTLSTVLNKATSGSSHLYDIPSLDNDGTNFHIGEDLKPDAAMQPDELEEWLVKDKEAHAQLMLTLKDKPLNGVLYSTTSAEVWKKLSE
ncbi:hypothetical protein SCLCIDRAFT_28601 [Scleroderma citrinum Foug A]|uniref:Uncharacterized protein n=1 Tax=Scleroderma citrinum Foug A TaxID=1036808 RepID=A0A0C3DNE4_9AGAM|nr:hypothetical protein SCLCIDRAFT_28601 [Scleroderma citrinum Foug A]